LIFEEVEVLDFAGPLEVFNVTAELNDPAPFNVYLVAETAAPVKTRGKLVVHPNYSLYDAPPADILLVPGGAGSRALLKKPHVLNWLREQAGRAERLCSVCTGALVLAKAGLLVGLTATTHHDNLDELRALVDERTTLVSDRRYVDNGQILMSGGVSAGIDMSLYLVRQLLGDDVLKKTLSEMEYSWTPATALTWPDDVQ
jgi:transcriptional regulator GlxA family with amidase domain